MINKVKDFSQKALKVLLTFAMLLGSASSSVVTAHEADTAKVEEAFESIENEMPTLGETDRDEQSDEIIVEESQEGLEQEEQIEEDEASILEEKNSDGRQVGEISDEEIEEADYSTRNIANTVNVGDFDELQSEITAAPTDGTLRIIHIMDDIEFNNVIVISGGRNIMIQSTGDYTLAQESGRHFNVGANGSLTLQEGVTLNGNLQGGGVNVAGTGAMFTMNGGTISDNTAANGGGVSIGTNGTFTMNEGGTISDNIATSTAANGGGGGVSITSNGMFTMNGGTISDNIATSTAANSGGGGVRSSGMFTMNGGTISDNIATSTATNGGGGGVHVGGTHGTFEMTGGEIINNEAITNGGGVYVAGTNTIFTMTGGEIINNEATTNGGGVHAAGTNGTFEMTGGEIINNEATTNGGGVHVAGTNTIFTMTGVTISGNTAIGNGGGVHRTSLSANEDVFAVGANVQFSGNEANVAVHPSANAASLFPNIQATSSSIFNHPLNNYDIGFTSSNPGLTQRTLTATSVPAMGGHIRLAEESENLSSLAFFGEGVPIGIEAHPAPGYEFVEWESNSGSFDDVTSMNTVFTTPNANTTITAVFVERVYDVTFEGNGGEVNGALYYVLQVAIDEEFDNVNHPIATRNNWDFADWYDDSKGGDAILPTHIIEGDETVYAQWNATVSFIMNDGSTTTPIDERSIREGDAIGTLPGDPSRDHYIFQAWHTADGELVDEYFEPTDGHVNVYAQWETIEVPVIPPVQEWTVTFMDGERVVAVQTVEDESLLNEPEAPERSGYVFEGWYEHDEDTPLFTRLLRTIAQRQWDFENDRVIGDITLQARWSEVMEEDDDERPVNPTENLPARLGLPQTGAVTTGVLLGGLVLTVSGIAIASKKRKDKK